MAELLIEQLVDVVHVVKRVVKEELQLWDDAQLMALQFAKLEPYLRGMLIDIAQHFFSPLRRKNAEVCLGHTEVGTDAHDADADEEVACLASLCLKNVAQVFLYETSYFVLSCCFHCMNWGFFL